MAALLHQLRKRLMRRDREDQVKRPLVAAASSLVTSPVADIAYNDPIIPYFLSNPDTVEIDKLQLDSPTLHALKAAGVKVVIPLVSQGELVGLLNLGPRRSEQDYSTDDRNVLNTLAAQAAPAVRVAQMVREQQAAALERERIENELRVARLIQQTLLPKELPKLAGWDFATYYQPAREVGGDFFDFLYFDDGRMAIVIGDVTDKGVPAALVMATTRSILRTAAQRLISPGQVLERVNDLLHPDIPPKMFVTCFYAVLDPSTGLLQYANAGHDLPYRQYKGEASELRATGMPLGLMPGIVYEEKETMLEPGENILFYSDGLVEAHNPQREMFGFPRLMRLVADYDHRMSMIELLLGQLSAFTGDGWEQEDDVAMITLRYTGSHMWDTNEDAHAMDAEPVESDILSDSPWHMLAELSIPSEPDNERIAMEQVADVVKGLPLSKKRLENLKTAVAEAALNAMEHGNHYQPDLPVSLSVLASETDVKVRIRDRGGISIPEPELPDIEAKLAGQQSPRGWGLFLIKNLVDEMLISSDETHHTVELIMHLEGR